MAPRPATQQAGPCPQSPRPGRLLEIVLLATYRTLPLSQGPTSIGQQAMGLQTCSSLDRMAGILAIGGTTVVSVYISSTFDDLNL